MGLHLTRSLALLCLAALGCTQDEAATPASLTESELLVGQWHIADNVAPVDARFSSDKTYRVAQDFGAMPFVQEGTWDLARPHHLVQTHATGRNTEAIFVDPRNLVIGGVLVRKTATGPGLEGEWETLRTVEIKKNDGTFALSSHTLRTVTFQAGGGGVLRATTERDDGSSSESSDTLTWRQIDPRTFELDGGLRGTHSLLGESLAPLGNAYERVSP